MIENAITIRPPWSWAIAEATALAALGIRPKLTENRGRPIPAKYIRQDIGIHSGRTWCPIGEADPKLRKAWATFANAIDYHQPHPLLKAIGDDRTGYIGRLQPGPWLETGAIVAVATITDCHEAQQRPGGATCCEPSWGQRTYTTATGVGPAWHLTLTYVRRLRTPVAATGKQLVPWRLPGDIASAVNAHLAEVAR